MVSVKIKDLSEAPEDLVQFVRHLQENYDDSDRNYNLEISITSKDYNNLPGSDINTSSRKTPDLKEKGVKLFFEWDDDILESDYIRLAESYYGSDNVLVVGQHRCSENERDIYIFEKKE